MFLPVLKNHLCILHNPHNKFILFTSFPGFEKPLLTEGQSWTGVRGNGRRCSFLRMTKVNKDGTFTAQYQSPYGSTPGNGREVAVTGRYNSAGSVISFSMSHKNDYFDFESVSAYAGHVNNYDPMIQTIYLLSQKAGATEVGFEQFYSSAIVCPLK